MGTSVLSLRIDGELLDRLRHHAGIRGMNVQDYVIRTLVRTDFDERFKAAVEETQRFYGDGDQGPYEQSYGQPEPEQPGHSARRSPGRHAAPATQVSPSAGIR
ncbi:hypothetical protein [Streptomyces indicus]|uniref:Ribbon-helix-helix protein, copG family n=1 Tax=Streptomyces indicus TaxID=417292 RepID=A0A1G9HU78_9ACTN|nr:hypothetical protein [Streptomyces indicus]SDL16537.1 hypothetical protein SAMN05421806_12045 [Streptomyces indicus]